MDDRGEERGERKGWGERERKVGWGEVERKGGGER